MRIEYLVKGQVETFGFNIELLGCGVLGFVQLFATQVKFCMNIVIKYICTKYTPYAVA